MFLGGFSPAKHFREIGTFFVGVTLWSNYWVYDSFIVLDGIIALLIFKVFLFLEEVVDD